MELKDILQWIALAVTFGLGVWNFVASAQSARKVRFINTVTNQRVLWIEQLRQDIARFIGLAGSMAYDQTIHLDGEHANRIELGRLRRVISLRLNPTSALDQEIDRLLEPIFRSAFAHDLSFKTEDHLDRLTDLSQSLLKAEWEKVKAEAESGRLQTAEPPDVAARSGA